MAFGDPSREDAAADAVPAVAAFRVFRGAALVDDHRVARDTARRVVRADRASDMTLRAYVQRWSLWPDSDGSEAEILVYETRNRGDQGNASRDGRYYTGFDK